MTSSLKSSLVKVMQQWLDENCDGLGCTSEIWQDSQPTRFNAHLMASGAELVIDAMALQSKLEDKLNPTPTKRKD